MTSNITIGQYFPGNSVIHRMDPRTKLVLTVVYITMLFVADNLWSMLICILFGVSLYLIAKIPLVMVWRSIKRILPIVIFTAVVNMFFATGEPIFKIWIITITDNGIKAALLMTARIVSLISGTSILTYTTSPIALTDGIERLFSPLKRFNMPVHEVAMMMTIALRFIPTLIEETNKIMAAQKARGADMESGNLIQRIKALLPIMIPLFVSAFRRADELALAMESRCYHGGEGRTRMRQLKLGIIDMLSAAMVLAVLAAVIYTKGLPGLGAI